MEGGELDDELAGDRGGDRRRGVHCVVAHRVGGGRLHAHQHPKHSHARRRGVRQLQTPDRVGGTAAGVEVADEQLQRRGNQR